MTLTAAVAASILVTSSFLFREPEKSIPPIQTAAVHADWKQTYARLPMSFEANRGQADPAVLFQSRGAGYGVFLAPGKAVLVLAKKHGESPVLSVHLAGANLRPQVKGEEELPGKSHYFRGNDPAKWGTDIPSYARVRYNQVYPGIDLLYYGNGRQLEYEFIVSPAADPSSIRISSEGIGQMKLDDNGDLLLNVGDAELRMVKPLVYQQVHGSRHGNCGTVCFA